MHDGRGGPSGGERIEVEEMVVMGDGWIGGLVFG